MTRSRMATIDTKAVAIGVAFGLVLAAAGAQAAPRINQIVVDGSINPASADYIIQAIEQSEADGEPGVAKVEDPEQGLGAGLPTAPAQEADGIGQRGDEGEPADRGRLGQRCPAEAGQGGQRQRQAIEAAEGLGQ